MANVDDKSGSSTPSQGNENNGNGNNSQGSSQTGFSLVRDKTTGAPVYVSDTVLAREGSSGYNVAPSTVAAAQARSGISPQANVSNASNAPKQYVKTMSKRFGFGEAVSSSGVAIPAFQGKAYTFGYEQKPVKEVSEQPRERGMTPLENIVYQSAGMIEGAPVLSYLKFRGEEIERTSAEPVSGRFVGGVIRAPEMMLKTGVSIVGIGAQYVAESPVNRAVFPSLEGFTTSEVKSRGVEASRKAVSEAAVNPETYVGAFALAGMAGALSKAPVKSAKLGEVPQSSVVPESFIGISKIKLSERAGSGSAGFSPGSITTNAQLGRGAGGGVASAAKGSFRFNIPEAQSPTGYIGLRLDSRAIVGIKLEAGKASPVLGEPKFSRGYKPLTTSVEGEAGSANVADTYSSVSSRLYRSNLERYSKATKQPEVFEKFVIEEQATKYAHPREIPFEMGLEMLGEAKTLKGLPEQALLNVREVITSKRGKIEYIYGSTSMKFRNALGKRAPGDVDAQLKGFRIGIGASGEAFATDIVGAINRGGGKARVVEKTVNVKTPAGWEKAFDIHDMAQEPGTALVRGEGELIGFGLGKKTPVKYEGIPYIASGEQIARLGSSVAAIRETPSGRLFLSPSLAKIQRTADFIAAVEKTAEVHGSAKYRTFGKTLSKYLTKEELDFIKSGEAKPDILLYKSPPKGSPMRFGAGSYGGTYASTSPSKSRPSLPSLPSLSQSLRSRSPSPSPSKSTPSPSPNDPSPPSTPSISLPSMSKGGSPSLRSPPSTPSFSFGSFTGLAQGAPFAFPFGAGGGGSGYGGSSRGASLKLIDIGTLSRRLMRRRK